MGTLSSLVRDIQSLVECESPSEDKQAIARSAETVARVGGALLGVEPESIVVDGTTHLRWRFGTAPRRILILAHHDTVWPIGSLESRPFTNLDGVLRGPGVFDMKSGLAMALHALAELGDDGRDGISLLVTGDEEIGSPSSRALIEDEARGMDATLVLEPSADGGALKTSRKGMSAYRLDISGRASHAGLDPDAGVNAGVELAHRILAVAKLGDRELETTATPTVATAGSTINTVPASARLTVDVRAWTAAEQRRVDSAIREVQSTVAGAHVTITGGINRPPMEEDMTLGLFARAQTVASRLGLDEPTRAAAGGASDGNFTAGMGIATLDGLGAVGGGAHAEDEYVVVDQLLPRVTLLRGLLENLLAHRKS
jgi:glutamate carboxypeptidase